MGWGQAEDQISILIFFLWKKIKNKWLCTKSKTYIQNTTRLQTFVRSVLLPQDKCSKCFLQQGASKNQLWTVLRKALVLTNFEFSLLCYLCLPLHKKNENCVQIFNPVSWLKNINPRVSFHVCDFILKLYC